MLEETSPITRISPCLLLLCTHFNTECYNLTWLCFCNLASDMCFLFFFFLCPLIHPCSFYCIYCAFHEFFKIPNHLVAQNLCINCLLFSECSLQYILSSLRWLKRGESYLRQQHPCQSLVQTDIFYLTALTVTYLIMYLMVYFHIFSWKQR